MPRPPFGPHCIRGKRLRGDVPLLQALPALPGCHHDIASPLHGDRLPRPTCPPTATQGPNKQRSEQATSASPGRTTTSVRKARPPAPEWPAPAAGIESSDSHWERLPPFTPSVHFYWLRRLSVILPWHANPPPSLALIGCGLLFVPPLVSARVPGSGWRTHAGWVGRAAQRAAGGGPEGSWERRPAPARRDWVDTDR